LCFFQKNEFFKNIRKLHLGNETVKAYLVEMIPGTQARYFIFEGLQNNLASWWNKLSKQHVPIWEHWSYGDKKCRIFR